MRNKKNWRTIALIILIGLIVFSFLVIQRANVNPFRLFYNLTFEKMNWTLNQARVGLQPICGLDNEWTVLVAGVDYREANYLYGLSDAIRVVRVDFTKPQINVVPLQRDLVVDPPSAMDIEGVMMLNQTYFFGTEGMGHFDGEGFGAGALAAAIEENFEVPIDHYLVINLEIFAQVVNAIGGIEVDLPVLVDDRPISYFPAGKQTLNGAQALNLARARQNYSDSFRINSQSIILNAIFDRIKDPAVLLRLPGIYQAIANSILTDLSAGDIATLLCLVPRMDADVLFFAEPPLDILVSEYQYIPNMSQQMMVYHWDERFPDWIQAALRHGQASSAPSE